MSTDSDIRLAAMYATYSAVVDFDGRVAVVPPFVAEGIAKLRGELAQKEESELPRARPPTGREWYEKIAAVHDDAERRYAIVHEDLHQAKKDLREIQSLVTALTSVVEVINTVTVTTSSTWAVGGWEEWDVRKKLVCKNAAQALANVAESRGDFVQGKRVTVKLPGGERDDLLEVAGYTPGIGWKNVFVPLNGKITKDVK